MTDAAPPVPGFEAPALFLRAGDEIRPTIYTQGPWDPNAQHGGPASALLAWTVEQVPTLVPMRVARYTFDLTRPVPLTPLHTKARVLREGKRVQLVEAAILSGDVEVARCVALRVRVGDTSQPEVMDNPRRPMLDQPPRPTGRGRPLVAAPDGLTLPGFIRAIEAERVVGEPMSGAPAITWFRLRVPVIDGETTSPSVRLAAMADFASGTGSFLDYQRYSSINADVTLYVAREPVGEWVAVDAMNFVNDDGIGHGRASLFDLDGFLGTAAVALVVEERPAPFYRAPDRR